jgi:hypothetical protein
MNNYYKKKLGFNSDATLSLLNGVEDKKKLVNYWF